MTVEKVGEFFDYNDLVDTITRKGFNYIPLDYILSELEKQPVWDKARRYCPKMKNGDLRNIVKKEMKKYVNYMKKHYRLEPQIIRHGFPNTSRIRTLEVFPINYQPLFTRFFEIRFDAETKSFGCAANTYSKILTTIYA